MCKPDQCKNCITCPAKRRDWRLESTQEDLKLELDQRYSDIKEYLTNASGDVIEGVLDNLLEDFGLTVKQCVKCGVKWEGV